MEVGRNSVYVQLGNDSVLLFAGDSSRIEASKRRRRYSLDAAIPANRSYIEFARELNFETEAGPIIFVRSGR
jgi:hypothetical protein